MSMPHSLPDTLRPIHFERHWQSTQDAVSCMSHCGDTMVLCSASFSHKVPQHAKDKNIGWLSAEYSMLPAATHIRQPREAQLGKLSGRTQEIQRLIGRSLRAAVNLADMPNLLIQVDCDVLRADGGTRIASINGACIALYDLLDYLVREGILLHNPWRTCVAGISVGWTNNKICVDMDYVQDSQCDVDLNMVMNEAGHMIEVQGSSEGASAPWSVVQDMMLQGQAAMRQVLAIQKEVLGIS